MAVEASATFLGSMSTLAVVITQALAAHVKGKRGKTALARIENKIDDSIAAQRTCNESFDQRISGAYYILTGASDESGTNGVRGNQKDHEARIRRIEERRVGPPDRRESA